MNVTIQLTIDQVVDLIQQIPPKEKIAILTTLSEQAYAGEVERMKDAESKMRQVCTERGVDWDSMTEDERLYFINDIVHEDRECNQ